MNNLGSRLFKASQFQARRLATDSPQLQPTAALVRDWIADSLYNPKYGYFNSTNVPVGQMLQRIEFNSLAGQQAYLQQLRRLYDQLQVSWLTPAEIFQPTFGQAIAQCILKEHKCLQPLNIIEIGAGSGRLAKDILDYLETKDEQVYAGTSYTTLEISPQLAAMQQRKVTANGRHQQCFTVVQQDALTSLAWDVPAEQPCVILMMEVLDNMPHDRVWRSDAASAWQETWIESVHVAQQQHEHEHREALRPAADPLVLACLEAAHSSLQQHTAGEALPWLHAAMEWALGPSESGRSGGEAAWLPTGCLQLLQHISHAKPNHTIIAADFDELPEVVIPGWNAPLVASTVSGDTLDHASILAPKGSADIFFPTNFKLLQELHLATLQKPGKESQFKGMACKTRSFMAKYADVTATSTSSGYNPLLEDFGNTAFYVGRAGICSQ